MTYLKKLESDLAPRTPKDMTIAISKITALVDRLNQNFQFVDPLDLLNCTSNEYGSPQIMGGSLPQLVDRLTHHNISGL